MVINSGYHPLTMISLSGKTLSHYTLNGSAIDTQCLSGYI